MNKEEIIEWVWRAYPVGTVFKNGGSGDSVIVYRLPGEMDWMRTPTSKWMTIMDTLSRPDIRSEFGGDYFSINFTADSLKVIIRYLSQISYNDPNAIRFEGE